jgi:hypothetical protein
LFGVIVLISCLEPIWNLVREKKTDIALKYGKEEAVIEESKKTF